MMEELTWYLHLDSLNLFGGGSGLVSRLVFKTSWPG